MLVQFRHGSQVHRLVLLLSVVGEYPVRSLHLLGNERSYKALVHRLTSVHTIRNCNTGDEITCRLLSISGKAGYKSIRLYKAALPILEWISDKSLPHYMHSFWNHHFPGNLSHRERNHRVAEAAAMCMRSEFVFEPYKLPHLQNQELLSVIPRQKCFYFAKDLKAIGTGELNKTIFTRLVGAMFYETGVFAVYNTRNALMKWNGMGEFKTLHNLIEITRMNAKNLPGEVSSAILFGESDKIALDTLMASDDSKRLEFRFDSIYKHIHFVPMNDFGIHLLKILTVPDWNENLLSLLFDAETRSYNQGQFEYDAFIDGKYIFSHLDSDIARLTRFRDAIAMQNLAFEVLCFPEQVGFVRSYLGGHINIKTISIESVDSLLFADYKEG